MRANPKTPALSPRVASKPLGGFHPITVVQLNMAWWAYRTGFLPRYLDFRVYLALHEVAERRLANARCRKRKIDPRLTVVPPRSELLREIRSIVGSTSDRLIREALSRLESTGLVTLAGRFLGFATGPASLKNAPDSLLTVLRGVSSERRLPVPRAMLFMMACSATPSLAATVFGYLLKCVWWRRNELHVEGCCTARFISERFGMDERSVKRARSELRRIGWLVCVPSRNDEVHEGPNLTWERERTKGSGERESGTVLSPLAIGSDTKMSPSTTCTQLRSGSKYQQRDGFKKAGIRGKEEPIRTPRLANIRPWDLSSPSRLNLLFEEAGSRSLIGRSEADRLRFFAAAARASRLGLRNQCGFFATIVRRGLWHFLSQVDEDQAVERLRIGRRLIPGSPKDRDRNAATNPTVADGKRTGGIANLLVVVASVAARCSMERSTRVNGKVGCPAARGPAWPAEAFLALTEGEESRLTDRGSNVTLAEGHSVLLSGEG